MFASKQTSAFRSLAVTLSVSFSILIMVVLLVSSSLQMYFSFNVQQNHIKQNLNLIAQKTASTFESFIQEKFSMLETTAKRRDLIAHPRKEQETILGRLMGLEPAFRQLVLYSGQEKELVKVSRIADPISSQMLKYNHNEFFHAVGQNKKYIGPVYIDRVTSEPIMIMAVPATDIFGDYKGVLLAETNLKFMWDLMDQIQIGKTGQAYVVEKQGYLIAYRDISRVLKRESLGHLREVQLFIEGKAAPNEISAGVSKGILGANVMTARVPLETTDWAVIVELPIMEAYQSMIRTLGLSLLVMLLSIVIAIILGVFLSRRLTKPIIELRDAAKKIGKGQLSLEIDIDASNEIGDLASTFNDMVKDLQNTTVSKNALLAEVNERKQVEKVLLESEQKMKAILMASPIGIGLVSNNKLEWANETLFTMAGYEEKTLLGQSISILYPSHIEYERVEKELSSVITGSRSGHIETQWIRRNGTTLDCILGSCPLDPANPSKSQIITVIDISESKRLQSKLLRAQKMEVVGTLAAGVAHDLNNILSGIVSYPELILMDMSENHPLKAPLLTIKKAGGRAAAIVQVLLTLSRRGLAINEVLNLNDIVSEFLMSPEYENIRSFHRNIKVESHLDNLLLNMMGSSAHLSKVLMNLVSNAAEAITDSGLIDISTKNRYLDKPVSGYENIDEGEYVTLTVSDTGDGISKADLLKIFEPFYTKKKLGRSGTGLGMTVVWGTVKDHNGYIDIKSEATKGTTCTIYFPASRKEVIEKRASIPIDQYMARGESILVVDDVEEQRLIVSKILSKLGYTVTTVSSGEEAFTYMSSNSVDLIVLDMIMDPGINGLETYRRILTLHPKQKAIIASGFSETEHVIEALRIGAGAYLKKPYDFEQIGRAIRNELDK